MSARNNGHREQSSTRRATDKAAMLLTRVLRMSGAGEAKDMEYDDSPTVSPVVSLVSSRTESPEFPAESPPQQSSRGAIFRLPKLKWSWKSARIFPFKGRQIGGDAMDSDFMGGDVRIADPC